MGEMRLCSIVITNTAPAEDDTLTPNDAAKIARELNDAQSESFGLGLELEVPLPTIESIHLQHRRPRDCLLHVIIAFLKQVEPRPTWGIIVKALMSPVVNLPVLARKVEATHFPNHEATLQAIKGV